MVTIDGTVAAFDRHSEAAIVFLGFFRLRPPPTKFEHQPPLALICLLRNVVFCIVCRVYVVSVHLTVQGVHNTGLNGKVINELLIEWDIHRVMGDVYVDR